MNLLSVDASPRVGRSRSRHVAAHLVDVLAERHGAKVTRRDLAQEPPPHLDAAFLDAYSTAPADRTPQHHAALTYSDMLVDEFLAADTVVVSTPMWNFNVPSTLKSWIDHIVRLGRTVSVTDSGFEGLASGKKMYVVLGSGDYYSHGPLAMHDAVTPSLRAAFSFISLHDLEFLRVEGTNQPQTRDSVVAQAIAEIDRRFR
ncbi:FMN-dependent NADH-azoreductase [Streptomyces sp. NPDC058891]|uniref:FMN-dependent NADH-azoreductase n=1 Tax=Streptomyces sp. NPDC058891 TaxID=3346667 RepID=UPI0036ACCC5D